MPFRTKLQIVLVTQDDPSTLIEDIKEWVSKRGEVVRTSAESFDIGFKPGKPNQTLLTQPLRILNLGTRINHALSEAYVRTRTSGGVAKRLNQFDIDYVGQLVRLTDEELMRYKGIGKTTIEVIRAALAKYGLHLSGDEISTSE
jgi:hypothetical protein